MTENASLTIDDLITGLAERLKYADTCDEFKAYFEQRADLLCQVFGCDLERRGNELDRIAAENRQGARRLEEADHNENYAVLLYDVSGRHSLGFLNDCLKHLNLSLTPGASWLEGRPPRIERDLSDKYDEAICHKERELKNIYRAMVRDLLEYLFPGIGKWTVPSEKLFEMGLPTEKPDINDYF